MSAKFPLKLDGFLTSLAVFTVGNRSHSGDCSKILIGRLKRVTFPVNISTCLQ